MRRPAGICCRASSLVAWLLVLFTSLQLQLPRGEVLDCQPPRFATGPHKIRGWALQGKKKAAAQLHCDISWTDLSQRPLRHPLQ